MIPRNLTPHCYVQRVQWYGDLCTGAVDARETCEAPVRAIVIPRINARAYVIDAPDMPRATMQRIAQEIGAHPALSWLASHSAELHR